MATDSGGAKKKKRTTDMTHREDTVAVGVPDPLQQYTTGYYDPNSFINNNGQVDVDAYTATTQVPGGGPPGSAPDPYTTANGVTADYVGNQFLDNPAAAVNNIMQGLGLSVSTNSPFYNQMQQLAPGLEWMHYFGNGTGNPGQFLGGVGNWFDSGVMSPQFSGKTGLGAMLGNFMSGGNNAELSAMIDNLAPEDIVRAMASMMETGLYGGAGSRVREGLQARLLDAYNQFVGNQPTIEAGLGAGTTIADAFRKFMNDQGILGQLGF